jgi:hypothetical protein
MRVHQVDGLATVQAGIARFREVLPIAWAKLSPFEIAAFRIPSNRMNSPSLGAIAKLQTLLDNPDKFDFKKLPDHTRAAEFAAIVRVCFQTRLVQRAAIAQTLTDALITVLRDWRTPDVETSNVGRLFRFGGSEFVFPVCQFALQSLLLSGNENCAVALLHGMVSATKADQLPTGWIYNCVTRKRRASNTENSDTAAGNSD